MSTVELTSWLMFGTATILAVITGYYAFQTQRLVQETRDNFRESVRAIVEVTFVRRGMIVVVRARNAGQRTASDIRFAYTPQDRALEDERLGGQRLAGFFHRGISLLAPGDSVYRDATATSVIQQWEASRPNEPLLVEFELAYFDGFAERKEAKAVDLRDVLTNEIAAPGPSPEMEPEARIARALETLALESGLGENLRRIADTLGSRSGY